MENLVIVCLALILAVTMVSSLPRAIELQSHYNEEGKFFTSIANFELGGSLDRLLNEVTPKVITLLSLFILIPIIIDCSLPCLVAF